MLRWQDQPRLDRPAPKRFMRIPTICAAAIVALCTPGLFAFTQAPPPATEVATALQAKYDKIRDFSADFVHSYEGGVLKRNVRERGVMQIKKPGKMRWEYQSPEKKLFVSDGRQMYLHEVGPNQVTVFAV